MKKTSKGKIIVLIILIIILIIGIKAFQDSRANKLIDITAIIADSSDLLNEQNQQIQAINNTEGRYQIILPDIVNTYKINKYIIEEKQLEQTEETSQVSQKVEKEPGDAIYLTEEEVSNKTINLTVKYDIKNKNEKNLYKRIIEEKINNEKIEIEGYMPNNASIEIKEVDKQDVEQTATEYINENTLLQIAYDIKILDGEEVYQPIDYQEEVEITISGIDTSNLENKTYKIIHIDDTDKTTQEIKEITVKEGEISFKADSFSTYAVLSETNEQATENQEEQAVENEIMTYAQSRAAIIHANEAWDGTTIATKFSWGSGTESTPYLIADGSELAYLAQQVAGGTTYEGQYFQLVADINLGNNEWTPIGTTTNSFRGILDGAGHAIANAKITISELPDNTYDSYGIFASIGGGTTRTIIRNIEFSNINIDITADGSTGSGNWWNQTQNEEGMHIGTVTGSLYRNASIVNVIVKSSNITDTNTISILDSEFELAVGGIAGYVTNTATSNTDPGTGLRYEIQNCFANVVIQLDAEAEFSTSGNAYNPARNGRAFYHTGGIVGTIRSQPVWPSNCLYQGQITSEGFIGPIFAALVNNTDPATYTNFNTIWQGNNAGNLTLQNGYYTEFSAYGTNYTATVTSGTSSNRRNTTNTNVGYIQGVNKGMYTNDKSTLLSMFNGNVTQDNKYLTWVYQDGTFTFKERLSTILQEPYPYTYEIVIDDPYDIGQYTLRWYMNGVEDSSIQGTTYTWPVSYESDQEVLVVTSEGQYFAITKFTIEKIRVDIVFEINKENDTVTAVLEGDGLNFTSEVDYSFQWYKYDIAGEGGAIEGETSLTLTNLEEGVDYVLIGTNNVIPQLSTENMFTYGERTVIYVNYSGGNDSRDGYTPETAVRTLSQAYSRFPSGGSRNTNVAVIMGAYSSNAIYNSATGTTYAKNVTLTGRYQGIDYNARLNFYSSTTTYRYLAGDTNFQYMDFYGNNNQMYLYAQGYSVTMGEGITMLSYTRANQNQGLLGSNAPAFHLICGWVRYNYTSLPRNNAEIVIKSGTYGRIILGGSPGTSQANSLNNTTSHNFMGSSMEDSFKIDLTIDIKNSTTATQYDYDVNLIVGGSAAGNNYSRVTENIKSGTVGRLLGGSIGDSSYIKTSISNSWRWPTNTFLGETTINMTGGKIAELYGGCLGRNMQSNTNICDSYFYGTININIQDGEIENNIYGAGAGGVTGYSINSSDTYKSYGETFDTSVNINITGGLINGNIYGGGYGYTEYLQERTTAADSGTLYGTSNITISGTPTINGNIYGAGCGYDLSSKPNLAQLEGDSNIIITETPTINGEIFGAGQGVSGYSEMAKLTGTSNITIGTDLDDKVYGGGNISKVEGITNININSGTHTQDIFGGGNLGVITGDTNVTINGGTSERIFGAGNQADVTNSIVNIIGGTINEIYAGGNQASVTTTKTYLKGGNVTTLYGGSNQTGDVGNTYIETTAGTISTIYGGNNIGGTTNQTDILINGGNITSTIYGGGNQVDVSKTNIDLKASENTISYIFGGGNQAGADTTQIYVNGISADKIFGGSNTNGTVPISNLEINAGIISNIYGGNNQGGTTQETNITANGGFINNIFGGGEKATTTTSNINTTGGNIFNIYGGGNEAGVTDSNIETSGGIIGNVFGGSNTSGDVETTNIITNNPATETTTDNGIDTQITYTASNTQSWQTTVYPTVATIRVTLRNTGTQQISKWNLSLFAPNSTLYTNYSNSDVQEKNGTYTITEKNRYWGNNTIPAGGSYDFEFTIFSHEQKDIFKIDYSVSGTTSGGDVVSDSEFGIRNIYGGNNHGGKTNVSNITINSEDVINVYGGGNEAVATSTNINITGKVLGKVYGGGNLAEIETNTNVNINGGTVEDDVYGGGNEGRVLGNTYVHTKNSTLRNNLYAGGNGSNAKVIGNTNLLMEGANNLVTNSVFGGGNKAETGEAQTNNSVSTVNIVSGTIGGNVYGGANTSVVYGTTKVNIGYDAVGDNTAELGKVDITGTVFGGGEANAAGDENYDFSFISVTRGIDIQINGNGYTDFNIRGSIFGSGNASSTSGESYIDIQNYGTPDSPKSNVSIQRATCTTLSNSSISLSGATDRTNEYSSTFFSLSRVDRVKLKNNSILYLCNGANLLKNLDSLVDENGTETKAVATINPDTGETTKNVDNRIYMLEGKNLNIATNEQVTAYGQVNGMIFFGLFTNRTNPSTSTGFYHNGYKNGDTITNAGTFTSNSYAMAQHMVDHDLTKDGFYTNFNQEGIIKTDYIETTPKDDVYYIWLVGEKMDVTKFEISLTASKYATLGTYELLLQGFSDPNIKFSLSGFSAGLANGISLVDPNQIEIIAPDQNVANTVYGLTMRTGNTGWQSKGTTTFLTQNGGSYTGQNDYDSDNSTFTPTLNFCFYHSENINVKQALGDVSIRLQVLTPIDDLNYKLSYIDIIVTLSTALYQNDFYEAAITPGEEFGLFATTETNITNKSIFSTYYSLYVDNFSDSEYIDEYWNDKRVIVSRDSNNMPYALPENTKLTMLDMVTNKYYYYVVTAQDIAENKYVYGLSDFIAMGSQNEKFDERQACDIYYNADQDLIYENFIFHINLADTNITQDIQNNSLLMELRNTENQILIGVLGIQRDSLIYSVYVDNDATIGINAQVNPSVVYLGNRFDLNVTTDFTQTIVNSKTIYDTQYFDKRLGIRISIYDSNGNRLNHDSLLGINFELDGIKYYPRVDGTTRINIADKVTNVLARIKVNTENNTTLATGEYTIKVDSFGSSDGIYYGLTASDTAEVNMQIINSAFGLKVRTSDKMKIINKDTGNTLNGSNSLTATVTYSSALSNPNIAVSLYRRNYSDVYSQDYTLVDLKDYVSDLLTPTSREKEYIAFGNPLSTMTGFMILKNNLVTGTYKLVYKLYDGDTYVGEAYEYFVIK